MSAVRKEKSVFLRPSLPQGLKATLPQRVDEAVKKLQASNAEREQILFDHNIATNFIVDSIRQTIDDYLMLRYSNRYRCKIEFNNGSSFYVVLVFQELASDRTTPTIDEKIRQLAAEAGIPASRLSDTSEAIVRLLATVNNELKAEIRDLIEKYGVPAAHLDETSEAIVLLLRDASQQEPRLAKMVLDESRSAGTWVSRVRHSDSPALPEQAPVLWADRKRTDPESGKPVVPPEDPETGKPWTPPGFVKHFYGAWLRADGSGLTRAHIKHLDPQLYTALANWLRHSDLPADCPLPTKSAQTDRLAELHGLSDRQPGQRTPGMVAAAIRQRKNRSSEKI